MSKNSPQGSPIATISDRDVLERLTSASGEPYEKKRSHFNSNVILPKMSNQSVDSLKCSLYSNPVDDTVHYMSPASTSRISPRTVDEGDLYGYVYKSPSFMHYLHALGKAPEASYISSSISCVEPEMQRTLAIVKPEYMKYEDVIMRAINEAGFTIIRVSTTTILHIFNIIIETNFFICLWNTFLRFALAVNENLTSSLYRVSSK